MKTTITIIGLFTLVSCGDFTSNEAPTCDTTKVTPTDTVAVDTTTVHGKTLPDVTPTFDTVKK